jgi:hypothetical protein
MLMNIGGIAAAAVAMLIHRSWHFSLISTLIAGAAVFGIAFTTRQFLAPPAFDFTVEHDHIEFAFASPEYAAVFRVQNKILGVSGVL